VAKFDPNLSGAASLVYSTYLGGSTALKGNLNWGAGYVPAITDVIHFPEIAGGIAVDSAGNAYVTSATTETNFPTTTGAYQTTSNIHAIKTTNLNPSDVFVTKLNPTGSALVYSTYFGGGRNGANGTCSGGASIAVDASGNAYVAGWTNSTSFPTVNPVQSTNSTGGVVDSLDSFVTVLNPTGSGLLFSSYLGSNGSNNYYGYGIALDSAANTYVGGAISGIGGAGGNGFVAKIDPPADTSEVSVPIDGTPAVGTGAFSNGSNDFLLAGYPPSAPHSGSLTASPNPVTSDSSLFLTASNLTAADSSSIIVQVAFYVQMSGTNSLLGYSTQTSSGNWSFTIAVKLTSGNDTLIALAKDSDGVFGDAAALTLTAQ
jgi:hypothetical protein